MTIEHKPKQLVLFAALGGSIALIAALLFKTWYSDRVSVPSVEASESLARVVSSKPARQFELHKDALRCLRLKGLNLPTDSCPPEALGLSIDEVLTELETAARAGSVKAMLAYGGAIEVKFGGSSGLIANREPAASMLRTNLSFLKQAADAGSNDALMHLFTDFQLGLYPDPRQVYAAGILRALALRDPNYPGAKSESDRMLSALPAADANAAERLAAEIVANSAAHAKRASVPLPLGD